ncbi:MAG TPA: hypothetical protein DIT47_03575 [Flavobacteriaceae bacterium]|nr:hypothetical protein [Flavobacteriaceae bacterium]
MNKLDSAECEKEWNSFSNSTSKAYFSPSPSPVLAHHKGTNFQVAKSALFGKFGKNRLHIIII